jgi:translation initiation factor IF-1
VTMQHHHARRSRPVTSSVLTSPFLSNYQNLLRLRRYHPMWHTRCFIARKDWLLSKDDLIDMQGTVVAVHSGGLYRVECDAGHEVLAQLSGRMRRFRIKVVPGDRVTVGVSPYDPVRGIITFRAR